MNVRSNEPFWLVKNGLLHAYPSLHHSLSCEILIVGSGITGALMAHACIKQGYKTILIDKREIANGSTSATTSMIQYEVDVPLHQLIKDIGEEGAVLSYKGCREAIYKLQELSKEVNSACGFELKESFYFSQNDKDTRWLKEEFETRKTYGFEVNWLEEQEIMKRYGIKAKAGILSKDGASLDAFQLAHDLIAYNHKKGLQVYDKTELKKVHYKENEVLVNLTTGVTVTAKKIIYCTGYETQQFLPKHVVKLKSTYACVSEQHPYLHEAIKKTLFWNTDKPYLYLRTTDDQRVLVGGEDESFKNSIKRDLLLDKKDEKLRKAFKQIIPGMQFLTDFRWAGTFGETKDGLPYIGSHQDFPNSYFVLGYGGNGITFSVMGMDMILDALNNKVHPLAEAFRFDR